MSAVLEEREPTLMEKLTTILALCVDDPEMFFREFLRVHSLRGWQKRACDEIKAQLQARNFRIAVLIRSCHGAGKTWFVAGLLLWFMCTRPHARGLTTAPTWKQVEDTLWGEVSKLFRGSILPGQFGRVLSSRFETGEKEWFASGVSSDHMENIEGQHSPTAAIRIVDEAKSVDSGMFDATSGIFTAPETLDIWISTPSIQSGKFYERDLGLENGTEGVIRLTVDIDELIDDESIPATDRDAFENWKQERLTEWGESSPEYQSRVLARYVSIAEGALFPAAWIEAAMQADFLVSGNPVVGMDVAGSIDGDANALALVTGPDRQDRMQLQRLDSWKQPDTMLSKGRALMFARNAEATLRIDSNGLGQGVYDAARHDDGGLDVEEYRASWAPRDVTRFTNRKAEDCWRLRKLLEDGKLRLVPNQELKTQLCSMKYELKENGKIRVIDPEDSPDLVDALIIAIAGSASGGPVLFGRGDDTRLSRADFGAF